MDKLDLIEQEIIDSINSFFSTAWEFNIKETLWTKNILEILEEIGIKHNYTVCSSVSKKKMNKRYLYDLIWQLKDNDNKLKKIKLTVEINWSRSFSRIKRDFEKLLITNSEKRLMICQSNPNKFDIFFNTFEDAIHNYEINSKGDRFLIAILDTTITNHFTHKLIRK